MSIMETYITASRARTKLTKEATRPDHDLRKLVLHANLLDTLMDRIHRHKPQQPEKEGYYTRGPGSVIQFASPEVTRATVTCIEPRDDDDDDDDDSDSDENEYYLSTEVSYSDDEEFYDDSCSSDDDSDLDDDEDDDDDDASTHYRISVVELGDPSQGGVIEIQHVEVQEEEEKEKENVSESEEDLSLERTPSNYRSLPLMEDLSELELEELDSVSESESDPESCDEEQKQEKVEVNLLAEKLQAVDVEAGEVKENEFQQVCARETEESDIVDLKKTPSLNYSSTTDDDYDYEEEEDDDVDEEKAASGKQLFYTTASSVPSSQLLMPRTSRSVKCTEGQIEINSLLLHHRLVSSAPEMDIKRQDVAC